MQSLNGKTALITGASSGIGEAIALQLAEQGMSLGLCGRNKEALQRVAQAVEEQGAKAHCFDMDLAAPNAAQTLAAQALESMGTVNALIHSAGMIRIGTVGEQPPEAVEAQLNLNALVPYTLTHALLPEIRNNQGDVIFINSRAGIMAFQRNSGYCMSKYALTALADILREELREDGVRVCSIFPGKVATPMQSQLQQIDDRPYTPSGHVAPEDIARFVVQALTLPPNTMLSNVVVEPVRKIK